MKKWEERLEKMNDYDKGYLIIESGGPNVIGVYTKDGKKIWDLEDGDYSIDADGNTYVVYNDNSIKKFDIDGNELLSKNSTDEIKGIIRNHIVIIKDGYMYLKNVDDDSEVKLGEFKDTDKYHDMISRYYERNELQNENEKEEGYYLIIEHDAAGQPNDENGNPGVEYYYNPKTKEVKEYDLEYIGGYAKPVLYLYPTEETNVTVDFEHEENLTTTYPKFKNNWEVTAKPNGDLYDKYGKYYYGLYWEEDKNHEVDFSEGFYVTKENAIDFLEEKLSIIGLNDRERNEFIMYWLPILERNEKNLVYFELTEERENYNKLLISPQPDSLLRVAIHVKRVDKETNITEEKLTKFERKGFTAVEWGGVLYN